MENVRNYEDVLKQIKTSKDYYETMLKAFEKVEIKRKKDGTHFVNKNQTFVNATITNDVRPELKVYAQSNMQGYLSFSFNCYLYEEDLKKDDERLNKLVKSSIYRSVYQFTTDEIIERLEEEKEHAKRMIELCDRQIEASEKIFQEVYERITDIKRYIKDSCSDFRYNNLYRCTLEYALVSFVEREIR